MTQSNEEIRQHHIRKVLSGRPNTERHISNVLMLSLGHLSAETRQKLKDESLCTSGMVSYPVHPVSEECILYITDLTQAVSESPYDLSSCMIYAADLGCDIIAFSTSRNFITHVLPLRDKVALEDKRISALSPHVIKPCKTGMLTISTAHISEKTNNMLQHAWDLTPDRTPKSWHLLSNKSGYGWILSINQPTPQQFLFQQDIAEELPDDLLRCMALAIERNCGLLCLDSDGYTVPYLPIKRRDEFCV